MNLKLYEEQKNSIYSLQKKMNLSKDCLYKYARGERLVKNMPVKTLLDIAYLEKVEPNLLFAKMLEYQEKRWNNEYRKYYTQ